MVLNAVQIVVTVFLLMALGYALVKVGWLTADGQKLISRLVVQVAVPATVISNMLTYYTGETLRASALGLLLPFGTMAISYLLAMGVARLIKLPSNKRGVFYVMFAFSNAVFLGLPYAEAIFGPSAVPYALLYYVGNTVLFWTIGAAGIRRDGGAAPAPMFSKATLKTLMSPALVAFAVSVVLLLLNISLPKFIMDTAKYLGGMVTPLSMLFIGAVLCRIGLKNLFFNKAVGFAMLGRFIVTPAIALAVGLLLPLPMLMKQTFMLQSSMPVMSQSSIVSAMYGADDSLAAVTTVLTTLLSLAYVPLLMLVMPHLPM